MKSTTIRVLLYLLLFSLFVLSIFIVLKHYAYDIDSAAPDALHFIGFVALVPMVSSVGGKLAERKITYIKNNTLFTPVVIATFVTTYASLIPWILSFFVTKNSYYVYVDWSIVLASITLSFILFGVLLAVFLRK